MKFSNLLLLMLSIFVLSCNKEHTQDPDYYLFDFDYNNSYYQNSNGQYVPTNKGYLMDTMYLDNVPTPTANIYINDGQIGDTLISSCGSYNYLSNPSLITFFSSGFLFVFKYLIDCFSSVKS